MAKIIKDQCRKLNISHFNALLLAGLLYFVQDFFAEQKAMASNVKANTIQLAVHESRLATVEIRCASHDEVDSKVGKLHSPHQTLGD